MLETPSGRQEFKGFPAFYEAEIAPYLAAKEAARRKAARKFWAIVGAVGATCALIVVYGPLGTANLHLAVAVGMAGAAGATWLLNRARDDIASGLLDLVCGRLGFQHVLKPGRPDYYAPFRRLRLLPNHNREAWEDEVRGAHADASFVMCEAHLRMKSSGKKSSTRTVFHGQLIALDYPKKFLGTTVLRRDAGLLNRFTKPDPAFSHVGLASAEFEKAFEAWSTDQVEARDLLDPVVLERFQALERLFNGKKLRAAFDEGRLLIAIETGDRLSIGSMFKPLDDKARVETILKEFDVIFDLIDVIVARVEGRLDTALSVEDVRAS